MPVMKASKKTVSSTQSISPVLDIRDGVVVTKNKEYLKILEFSPINFDLKAQADQNAAIERFAALIRTLPNRIHIKVVSIPSDVTPFVDDLLLCRENEIAQGNIGCAELIEDQIALIQKTAETQGVSRRFFIIVEYENKTSGLSSRRPPFSEIAASLKRDAREIKNIMAEIGNELLSTDDREYILNALYCIYCKVQFQVIPFEDRKEAILQRYNEGRNEEISEELIPVNDFFCPDKIDASISPNYIYIDGAYITYCYIPSTGYPNMVPGAWLSAIFGYMDCVDMDFFIERGDAEKIKNRLSFQLKGNLIKQYEKDVIAQDYESVQSAYQSGMYIKQSLAEGDDFFYMGTLLSIFAESPEQLDARYHELKNYLFRQDIRLRRCTFEQENAYISSLAVSSCNKNLWHKMRRNVMGSQLASAYPFTAYELAEKGGIFLGVNAYLGSPVFLNSFDRHINQSGSFILAGPAGSGKTYSLLLMLERLREKSSTAADLHVMAICPLKSQEFLRPCEALGGQFVRISPGSKNNINVMEIFLFDQGESVYLNNMLDRGSLLSMKISNLRPFFDLICKDRSESEERVLEDSLKAVYAAYGITTDNTSLWDEDGNPKRMPTLVDLYDILEREADGKRIRDALARFVHGSFDNFAKPTNVDLENKFIVFDVSELPEDMLPVGMYTVMEYVMSKAKATVTTNKIIAIDETWRLLKASPLAARYVRDCAKEIRGYGGNLLCASQDIHDFITDEIGGDIVNNARYKLFLPMDKKEIEEVCNIVDLTLEEQKELLSTNIKTNASRKALLVVNDEHMFIRVIASSREHDLITTNVNDLRRIAREKALQQES